MVTSTFVPHAIRMRLEMESRMDENARLNPYLRSFEQVKSSRIMEHFFGPIRMAYLLEMAGGGYIVRLRDDFCVTKAKA